MVVYNCALLIAGADRWMAVYSAKGNGVMAITFGKRKWVLKCYRRKKNLTAVPRFWRNELGSWCWCWWWTFLTF
jgi:hypothetical protein